MKTNKIKKILVLFILVFIISCDGDYKVKTIIHTDGSCERIMTVIFSEDWTEDFYELEHPIPVDTSWNLKMEIDTAENGDTVYIHTVQKKFNNIEELNALYNKDSTQYGIIDRSVEFVKKFRWFYTFIEYEETYQKLFNQTSLKNVMDSIEYNFIMLEDDAQEMYLKENFDSLGAVNFEEKVEEKFFKHIEVTIFNSCMDAIMESSKNITDWPYNNSFFPKKRDSIIKIIENDSDLLDFKDIKDMLSSEFEIDSILFRKLKNQEEFASFLDRYKFWEDNFLGTDYQNIFEMPGLIIESNSNNISDNRVSWEVHCNRYFTDDYVMHVQSRIVNMWAFWVSGGFIVLIIFAFILRRIIKP